MVFTSNRQPTPFLPRGQNNLSRFIQTGILSNNNIAVPLTFGKITSTSSGPRVIQFALKLNF